MTLSVPRSLEPKERKILDRLLSLDFPGRDQLREQINHSQVGQIDEDGSIRFFPPTTPRATVLQRVPVEGLAPDIDGYNVCFLLHVEHGLVVELEIFKEDGSPIKRLPEADQVQVVSFPSHFPDTFLGTTRVD